MHLQPQRPLPHDARPHDQDDEPLYNGRCRHAEPPPLNPTANYRFRVPDGETIFFLDRHLGPQSFTAGTHFGDFLVWRKPVPEDPHLGGLPSYQLACVIDDADMGITEGVRGADLLKSTARQILLQRALGLPAVDYFHTALLRDEHGVRLAKRHDVLALGTLRQQGLAPANVLARLAR